MKLAAVGVTTSNMKKTVSFYTILGFKFPNYNSEEGHVEAISPAGSVRLMIDLKQIIKDIINEDPKPGNHSIFALEYDSVEELNQIVIEVESAGFKSIKEPWDAFWGQRYAVVEDPDGYKVDLYAYIKK